MDGAKQITDTLEDNQFGCFGREVIWVGRSMSVSLCGPLWV